MRVLYIVAVVLLLSVSAFAGNTVRGPGGQASSLPEGGGGAILSLDVWKNIQEGEDSNFRAGFEAVLGTAKITDVLGRSMTSKKLLHVLPYLDYVKKLDDDFAFFVNLYAKDAQGFAFEKNFEQWGFDTEALIARINVGVGLSWKVDDVWTLALEADIGVEQLKLDYAFDINRFYLPILAKSRAYGIGIGATGAVICQATERLRLGLQVSSLMNIYCKGRTKLLRGKVSDTWTAEMPFPMSVTAAGSYQLTYRLGVCADVSWYDFKDDPLILKFNHWGFSKPLELGFGGVVAVRGGFNYQATDWLKFRVGGGWMTQGVDQKYADSTTTDFPGWYGALGFTAQVTGSIDISVAYTHAEGHSQEQSILPGILPGSKIEGGIETLMIEGCWKF